MEPRDTCRKAFWAKFGSILRNLTIVLVAFFLVATIWDLSFMAMYSGIDSDATESALVIAAEYSVFILTIEQPGGDNYHRNELICKEFGQLGINCSIYQGVNAEKGLAQLPWHARKWISLAPEKYKNKELGCAISHALLWEHALMHSCRSDHDKVLILEDDVGLNVTQVSKI